MEAKRRLSEIGLINDDWQPVKWSDRQYQSDSSTERVHKYREKQHETLQKRSGNGNGTFKSRADTEQIQIRTDKSQERRVRAPSATRLPEAFELTPEMRAEAVSEHLDPERTFAKFCDYWRAASGAKARKHDWVATWRNWCRTEADRGQVKPTGQKRRPRSADEIEAEYRAKGIDPHTGEPLNAIG